MIFDIGGSMLGLPLDFCVAPSHSFLERHVPYTSYVHNIHRGLLWCDTKYLPRKTKQRQCYKLAFTDIADIGFLFGL